jgi:4-hydroxybenzoate polyprenyltransferase
LNILADAKIDHSEKADIADWENRDMDHFARVRVGTWLSLGAASILLATGHALTALFQLLLYICAMAYSSYTFRHDISRPGFGLKHSVAGHFLAFVLGYLSIRLVGASLATGLDFRLVGLCLASSLADHALAALESTFDGEQERQAGMRSLGARWSLGQATAYCLGMQGLVALLGIIAGGAFGYAVIAASLIRMISAWRARTFLVRRGKEFSLAETAIDWGFVASRIVLLLGALIPSLE